MSTAMEDPDVAEVVISRDAENDIKMRGLEIFVDDLYAYDLGFNQAFAVKLAAGAHRIKVSNHLYKKTLELNLKPGERVDLQAGNRFTLLGGMMVSVLGMGPYKVFLKADPRSMVETS